VHEDGVGRPGAARGEERDGIEVPRGHEVDVAARVRGAQMGRVVPGGVADLARVRGRRERVVVEAQAAHQGERSEAIGLAEDLAQERARITAARR
jgi:hypothetical protein